MCSCIMKRMEAAKLGGMEGGIRVGAKITNNFKYANGITLTWTQVLSVWNMFQ